MFWFGIYQVLLSINSLSLEASLGSSAPNELTNVANWYDWAYQKVFLFFLNNSLCYISKKNCFSVMDYLTTMLLRHIVFFCVGNIDFTIVNFLITKEALTQTLHWIQ